ncbi:PhoH family protein [Hydrogenibacillus sp. N12]|nr:PhoH family protein [Hydrogenibacillus sp. N12]
MPTVSRTLTLRTTSEGQRLFGPRDRFLKRIEAAYPVAIHSRGDELVVVGEEAAAEAVMRLLDVLLKLIRRQELISDVDLDYAIRLNEEGDVYRLLDLYDDVVARTVRGQPVRAKTLGQKRYLSLLKTRDVVFAVGPAGTGKTFLAVVFAVLALKNQTVRRIVLTRPAVEAGERLGFLPGDLQEKVDPYLRPLYDALYEMMGAEQVARSMERGLIEIAPLAYMRGRTLDGAFIILDEAQNTTPEQMKMFLTRLGEGSKMVITGDLTQVDLPPGQKSGLRDALETLRGIEEIGMAELTETDVVRHPLVQKIIQAYENRGAGGEGRGAAKGGIGGSGERERSGRGEPGDGPAEPGLRRSGEAAFDAPATAGTDGGRPDVRSAKGGRAAAEVKRRG